MSRHISSEPVLPNKGNNLRIQSISMEIKLYNRVREKCIAEDRSFSNMITILVRRALKEPNVPQ